MASIIQCPNCSKKLKLKSVPSGKKVKCPGCQKAFLPGGGGGNSGGPKRKKKARVADDFVDFDDDEQFDDGDFGDEYDEPVRERRRPAQGGRKQGGRKGSKGGKNKAASKKSKAPLFIGIGVLSAALVGGLVFMLTQGGDDPADDNNVADAGGADSGDGDGSGSDSSGSDAAGGSSADGTTGTDSNAGGSTDSSTQNTASTSSANAGGAEIVPGVSTQYLPADSELVASINVQQLLSGPLKNMLTMAGPQIHEFKTNFGFGPEDIQSITIGGAGISDAVSSGAPPDPNSMPFTVVFRAANPVDLSKLQQALPNAEEVSDGGLTYIRVPDEDPPGAIWMADSTTVVLGAEQWVKQVAGGGGGSTFVDASLFDSSSAIRVAFAPGNPDAVFRAMPLPPAAGSPPEQMLLDFVKVVQPTIGAVGIGLDLGSDIMLTGAIKCATPNAATSTSQALEKLVGQAKQMQEAQAAQMQSGGGGPGLGMGPMAMAAQGTAIMNSFKTELKGQTAAFSFTAPKGGDQLALAAPMMIPMMMQSMEAGRQAGEHIRGQNNLKQITIALLNFHDAWGRYPNAAPQGPNGEKWLSWRVHILPYLEQNDLYEKFALEEPWDSPTNRPLVDLMPQVFAAPGMALEPGKTLIQVPIGPGTMFEDAKGRGLRNCVDGTSNTIQFVQVAPERAVYWTQPEDYAWDPASPAAGLKDDDGMITVALADGSLKMFDAGADPEVVKLLFTRNDSQPLPPDLLMPVGPGSGGGGGFGPPMGGGGGPVGGFGPRGSEATVTFGDNGDKFSVVQAREWKDSSGKVLVNGKPFGDLKDGKVQFRRSDNGEVVTIPLNQLDEASQQEIQFWAE